MQDITGGPGLLLQCRRGPQSLGRPLHWIPSWCHFTRGSPLPLPLQGQKRLVLSESCSRDSMTSQPSCTALNYSYGVNAWKSWVQAKYAGGETSKGDELRFGRKSETCGQGGQSVGRVRVPLPPAAPACSCW